MSVDLKVCLEWPEFSESAEIEYNDEQVRIVTADGEEFYLTFQQVNDMALAIRVFDPDTECDLFA